MSIHQIFRDRPNVSCHANKDWGCSIYGPIQMKSRTNSSKQSVGYWKVGAFLHMRMDSGTPSKANKASSRDGVGWERMAWGGDWQGRGRLGLGGGQDCQGQRRPNPKLLPDLSHLHRATWTCANDETGTSPGYLIAVAGPYQCMETNVPLPYGDHLLTKIIMGCSRSCAAPASLLCYFGYTSMRTFFDLG